MPVLRAHLVDGRVLVKFSPDQPRDDHGRWTGAGDGSAEHPIPCHDDIEKAARLIAQGKHVTLDQPDEVATLTEKLAAEARVAKAHGEHATPINVALISVPGTNLFAQDNLGIDRIHMPQFSGVPNPGTPADALPRDAKGEIDLGPTFIQELRDQGISVTDRTVLASHLRATQDELDGAKIGMIADAMRAGKVPEAAIFVTRDNYILDGHHRWAATIVNDAEFDNRLGDLSMPVHSINLDIGTALTKANEFSDKWGTHWGMGGPTNTASTVKAFNPDQPRDDHGRWTSGGSGEPALEAGDVIDSVKAMHYGRDGYLSSLAAVENRADNNNPETGVNRNGACAKMGLKVDWGSADPADAKRADDELARLLTAYPSAKVVEVGTARSGQTEQQTWGDTLANGTVAFTEEVSPEAKLRQLGINPTTWDVGDNPTPAMQATVDTYNESVSHPDPVGTRIMLNPAILSIPGGSDTMSNYSTDEGFTAERGIEQVVGHEFAHALAFQAGTGTGEVIRQAAEQGAFPMPEWGVPGYVTASPQEGLAEAWTVVRTTPNPPAWAAGIVRVGLPGIDPNLAPLTIFKSYNPDEPRDDHGRWTSGGSTQQAVDAAYASAVASDESAARGKTARDFSPHVEISPEKQAENHRLNENLVQGTDARVLHDALHEPQAIDYGVIDPATAQRINRELSTLQSKYPGVDLGTVRAGNLQPGVYAETDDGSGGDTPQTITFNQGMMDAPGELRTRLTTDSLSAFHPPNCDKPEFIAAHEYGHALANSLPRQSLSAIAQAGMNTLQAGYVSHTYVGENLSRYAQTNVQEFVAEAFGDYAVNGSNAQVVSQEIGRGLETAYHSRYGKAATPDLSKFSPDQPRDERGRWTVTGGITDAEASDLVTQGIAGGFSYNPTTHRSPTSGYMVARAGATVTVAAGSKAEGAKGLVTFIDQHHAMFEADPSLYIGGWVEDGKLWIEPSDNIADRAFAEQVGAKRDQIAIFDVKALDVIQTGGTGGDRADPAWNVHPDLIPRGKAADVPAPAGGVAADVAKREGSLGRGRAGAPVPGRVDHWPGWGVDEQLVEHFAPRIAHAIQGNINVDALVDALHMTKAAQPGEFAHHLDTARRVVGAFGVDTSGIKVLTDLYGQGYVLGTHSATQAADKMGWPAAQVYPASDAILRSPGLASLLGQANVTIQSVGANRLDRLATVLAQGMTDGKPPREIADDLRTVMLDQSWAETVARTETARAQTAGALNEYQRLGVDRVEFLTAQDDRECDLCLENEDAGIRDLTDPSAWPEGDPPVHPNCRCAMAPVPYTDSADAQAAAEDVNAPTLVGEGEKITEDVVAAREGAGLLDATQPEDTSGEESLLDRVLGHLEHRSPSEQSQQQDASLAELESSIMSSTYREEQGGPYTGFDQNVINARPDVTPPTPTPPGIVPIPPLPPEPNTPKPGSTTPKPSKQNGQTSRPRRPRPPKRG